MSSLALQPTTHILYRTSEYLRSRVIVALSWCGYRAPWGELVPDPKCPVRPARMIPRPYSASFLPARQPKERILHADLAELATCPHCRMNHSRGQAPAPKARRAL